MQLSGIGLIVRVGQAKGGQAQVGGGLHHGPRLRRREHFHDHPETKGEGE
jgi:hypothetical protein